MKWFAAVCALVLLLILCAAALLFCKSARRALSLDRADSPRFSASQWGPYQTRLCALREEIYALCHEQVSIQSADGLRLCANFFPAKERCGRAVVLVHGYHTPPHNNFSPAFFSYYKRNFDILLIDQRAHGASQGRYVTYGAMEKDDVRRWALYLSERLGPDVRIVLHGVSMGASTVMLCVGQKLPEQVAAYVADCGYTTAYRQFFYLMHRSVRIFAPLVVTTTLLFYRLFARCNLFSLNTAKAVASCRLPALFIHGSADDFVPASCSKQNVLACAAAQKELLVIRGAGHATSFLTDEQACDSALERLLQHAHLV